MKQPKTSEIVGEVANIQKKEGKKNPFYVVDILASIDGYDGKADEVVYQITAFGKMSDKVQALAVGDYVTVVAYVGSREWQGKWYPSLTLASIDVHTNVAPVEATGVQVTEQADGQDTSLPF
jgi:hypothetical protein